MGGIRDNKKLRIAIFHLAFVYSGGGEKLVIEEAGGLTKRGHQVEIFTPVVNRQKCFPDLMSQFPIKTFLPQLPLFLPEREPFQILLTCLFAPLLAFKFRKFDVILAANQPSPWLAWWVKKLFQAPYVSYLAQPTRILYPRRIDRRTGLAFTKKASLSFSAKMLRLAHQFIRWADRTSIKDSNSVLVNGRYMKGILEKTYGVKAVACPAGAHPAAKIVNYSARLKGQIKVGKKLISKPYLLITNRHFGQKRFEYGIFALSSILAEHPEYLLVITGRKTDYTREMEALVKRLELNRKVLFVGYVSEKDLGILYSHACLYLYTAPEEDFGMGMVEAMARGTPVVAWNNAGPTGIIKDGQTGLLAKPFVAADFSKKVLDLLVKKKLAEKIGLSAWKEVKKKFSYKVHLEILEKQLRNVL